MLNIMINFWFWYHHSSSAKLYVYTNYNTMVFTVSR